LGGVFVVGVLALLVILMALKRGTLKIENICDLSRKERPAEFYTTLGVAAFFIGLTVATIGYYFMTGFADIAAWSADHAD
jgi:formate hydrogenlyase subunit 4